MTFQDINTCSDAPQGKSAISHAHAHTMPCNLMRAPRINPRRTVNIIRHLAELIEPIGNGKCIELRNKNEVISLKLFVKCGRQHHLIVCRQAPHPRCRHALNSPRTMTGENISKPRYPESSRQEKGKLFVRENFFHLRKVYLFIPYKCPPRGRPARAQVPAVFVPCVPPTKKTARTLLRGQSPANLRLSDGFHSISCRTRSGRSCRPCGGRRR